MVGTGAEVVVDLDFCRRWMLELAAAVEASCDELTELDAAIGDADHGINLRRGARSVETWLTADEGILDPPDILTGVGNRFITEIGGASGPLYGTAFRTMGAVVDDSPLTLARLGDALSEGLDSIQRLGAAEPGDKTIVDAWTPAVRALDEAVRRGTSLDVALAAAQAAAATGRDATIGLRARKGRASYLGWRSEGHQDPGATSTHLIFKALVDAAS